MVGPQLNVNELLQVVYQLPATPLPANPRMVPVDDKRATKRRYEDERDPHRDRRQRR